MESILMSLESLKKESPEAYKQIFEMEASKQKWELTEKDKIATDIREDYIDIEKYCECETEKDKLKYIMTFGNDFRRTMTLREHFIIMGCYNKSLKEFATEEIYFLTKFYNTQMKNTNAKNSDDYLNDSDNACSSKDR